MVGDLITSKDARIKKKGGKMARDNELIITAGLDIPQTTEDISTDLEKVGDKLNSNHALKIICNIDVSKTTQAIQSQLNTISKDFSIKIGNIDLNTSTSNAVKNFDAISDSAEKANEKIAETKKRLADLDSKFTKPIKIVELADAEAIISKLKNQLSSLGTVTVTGKYINKTDGDDKSTESLNGLTATIKAVNGEVRTLNFLLDDTGTKFEYIGGSFSDKGIYQALAKATTEADKLFRQINNLKASADDTAASRPIMSEEGISKVAEAYKQAKTAIEAFRNANEGTYAELENNAKAAVDNLNNIIKSQRNLETAASKLRAQKIEVITGQEMTKLDKLEAMISGSMLSDVSSLISKVNDLRTQLSNVGNDKSALIEYQDSLSRFEAELQILKVQAQATSKAISLDNKIARASAALDVYANANKKAISSTKLMSDGVTTFAEKWDELTSRMNSGNLSADEFKHLNEELATFKQEVKAVGLDSGAFFRKMGDQIRLVVTQWISLNAVIGAVRNTTEELKRIDDILTEISKTSDRTTESLKKLGDTSYDTANKYGRKASDYLLGVQEMSRAGFGDQQSENLAELSILAQAAGDMTAEMSNEYIVATDAAYGLEGSIEKLNAVLDGQNYITNRNALSMENLSQATKVAASQASASGIAIDELSAAVGTMVATTQQGGDVAGRAFKGILMNLQQVKADASEIGDGGESITEESLSKYEEATKALGVSLKEVKNGVWELRDPMQILKELSEAVSKESQGSIKVANLINAVGGKFRGNQLIALLNNWETYEKMLSEFNSDQAVGSAMEEADKSANNWSGSLNKLSNSWSELVNRFIESDNAIEIVQSLNKVIQDLTDSKMTGALGTMADMLTGIIKLIGNVSDNFGVLPTLTGAIAGGLSFKGVGRPKNRICLIMHCCKINMRDDSHLLKIK